MAKLDIWLSAWDIISCHSGVYHKKKKTPKPLIHHSIVEIQQNYTRVAETGKLIQQKFRKKWIDEGILLAAENKIPNDWGLWCKFDAICKINGKNILYEVKGVGAEFFEKIKKTGKPREDNRTQLIIYHYFLREKYSGLQPILLYVNRKNFDETMELLVEYSNEEILKIKKITDELYQSILKETPLPPVENIVLDPFTNQYMVNPSAITCEYHGICVGDDYWYPKAAEEVARLNKDLEK